MMIVSFASMGSKVLKLIVKDIAFKVTFSDTVRDNLLNTAPI